ncbi:hypothetical protein HUX88_20675 [Duganella sp. BJB1802]|uniref:hypothetical protein n=1 Tax=Duganella sp. BJB1802 TaxID=2744575 RepID=UPI0015939D59|nr:hypothetical protein [Duganella sp. BJB1802]NVD72942.1 hypothetical protein [Duganella sp. BJB1802]
MHDIVADITFLDDVPEPVVNGVRGGYAPHHKFSELDWLASGFHQYQDETLHFPGETIEVKIRFVSWEYLRDIVRPGVHFEVRELDRVIGTGTVKAVRDGGL